MHAAGIVARAIRNDQIWERSAVVCGAPPQTSLLTLIGEW